MMEGHTLLPQFDMAQLAYYMKLNSALGKERKDTISHLKREGTSVNTSYNMTPGTLGSIIQESIINPSNLMLSQKITNLQHSNERFSGGRLAREEGARYDTAIQQQMGIADMINSERQLELQGNEQAYARMMTANQALGQGLLSPLSFNAKQNYIQPTQIGNFIGGVGQAIGGAGSLLTNLVNSSNNEGASPYSG